MLTFAPTAREIAANAAGYLWEHSTLGKLAEMDDIHAGTAEWRKLRLGKVTASRVADLLARTKTGWGSSRANYAAELVSERLTGVWTEGYHSVEMQWGSNHEAEAQAAYSFRTGNDLVPGPVFLDHPRVPMSGASPDRYIGDDGLAETKCPLSATHIDTLLSGKVPLKYQQQMTWQMAVTGRDWCDFVSFDPRLPPRMQLFIRRFERDAKAIADLEDQVLFFGNEVAATVRALEQRYGQ